MEICLLTQAEAREMRDAGEVMSVRTAHRKLSEERDRNQDPHASVDLSQDEFQWKKYLANRSDDMLEKVVGPGVSGIVLRYVCTTDSNTGNHRFDFVVHRTDGLAVRLHPQSNGKDTIPILGDPSLWKIDAPLPPAMPAGRMRVGEADEIFTEYSQADLIGKKAASQWLEERALEWVPGRVFRQDLTSAATFKWRLYLANRKWGNELLRDGVSAFWLIWLDRPHQHAAFYCEMTDGTKYVITPGTKTELRVDLINAINWWV